MRTGAGAQPGTENGDLLHEQAVGDVAAALSAGIAQILRDAAKRVRNEAPK
jgi:hypothetical protein